MTEKLKLVLGRVENIVGRGENAAFSPFPTMFSKGFFLRVVKTQDCVLELTLVVVKLQMEKAFSPFPSMFLKGFFLKAVKSRYCVVKT